MSNEPAKNLHKQDRTSKGTFARGGLYQILLNIEECLRAELRSAIKRT